jgi:hypothetical protein
VDFVSIFPANNERFRGTEMNLPLELEPDVPGACCQWEETHVKIDGEK